MNTAAVQVIAQIKRLGGRVEVSGENRIKVYHSRLPPELVQQIRDHKPEIIRLLQQGMPNHDGICAWLTRFWELIETRSGWSGRLCGVTKRGLLLDSGECMPVVEVDFESVLEPK